MKNIEKVYKVVTADYESAVIGIPGFRMKYTPGIWTGPMTKGAKLFCFKDLYFAKQFRRLVPSSLLWESEAKNVTEQKRILIYAFDLTNEILKKFWKGELKEGDPFAGLAGEGCYTCDKIKLVRLLSGQD